MLICSESESDQDSENTSLTKMLLSRTMLVVFFLSCLAFGIGEDDSDHENTDTNNNFKDYKVEVIPGKKDGSLSPHVSHK